MKRISVLLIALLMIAAVLPVNAITANGSYGEVPLYKGAITIDGKKDAIYDKGLILPIDKYIDSTKSESSGKLYILHDGSFLYVLFEAKSAYELTDYNPKYSQKDAYQTTGIQINMDWTNAATDGKANHKYDAFFDGRYWPSPDTPKAKEDDVEFKATVDKAAKTFVMEFKFKFQEGTKTGSEIGFNFVFDSDKTMGPDKNATRTVARLTTEGNFNNGADYKNITFSSKEVIAAAAAAAATTKAAATAAAKTGTTTAAKTADASVIIAAVVVSAAAAAVVLKKKH